MKVGKKKVQKGISDSDELNNYQMMALQARGCYFGPHLNIYSI